MVEFLSKLFFVLFILLAVSCSNGGGNTGRESSADTSDNSRLSNDPKSVSNTNTPYDDAFVEWRELMERATNILSTIPDNQNASDALVQIQGLGPLVDDLSRRFHELGPLTRQEYDDLLAKHYRANNVQVNLLASEFDRLTWDDLESRPQARKIAIALAKVERGWGHVMIHENSAAPSNQIDSKNQK